jgi:hypothetical protein
MPGLNPGLLRLWNSRSEALTTLLNLTGCWAFFPKPIEAVLNKEHIIQAKTGGKKYIKLFFITAALATEQDYSAAFPEYH